MPSKPTDRLLPRHRLLIECLRAESAADDLRPELSGLEWQEEEDFIDTAFRQGVHPLLYRRLKEKQLLDALDPAVKTRLAEGVMNYTIHYTRLSCSCRELLAVFHDAGIDCIVLKGMHLSLFAYDNPADRMMSDLDLLLRRTDLLKAAELLAAAGIAPHDYRPVEAETAFCHHLVPFVTNRGNPVELHWTLKLDVSLDLEGLWARSAAVESDGMTFRVLSPEDLLLHLSLNATIPDFEVKLRTFCDLDFALKRYAAEIDWEILLDRAGQWGIKKNLLLLLQATRTLFGNPLPAELFSGESAGDLLEMEQLLLQSIFASQMQERNQVLMLARLWRAGGLRDAAALAWNKLFYPQEVIASMYHLPAGSSPARLYLLRAWNLLARFSESLRHLVRHPASGNRELFAFDRNVERMKSWMRS